MGETHTRTRKRPDYIFSKLFGSGIYKILTNEMENDIFSGKKTMCVKNINSNETFLIRKIVSPLNDTHKYNRLITTPCSKHIFWPVDLLLIDKEISLDVTEIGHYYYYETNGDSKIDLQNKDNIKFLVFPQWNTSDLKIKTLQELLGDIKRTEKLNWHSNKIQMLLCSIARGFEELNQAGYFTLDIDLNRLFFMKGAKSDSWVLHFDFSDLIFFNDEKITSLPDDYYPYEFVEPAIIQGRGTQIDVHSQNYALASLFFFLMLGIYPYDGPLFENELSLNTAGSMGRYYRFRAFSEKPVFIFDESDKSNRIGIYAKDQEVISLWDSLPTIIREMFQSTLKRSNAERQEQPSKFGPTEWLNSFGELKSDRPS